MKEQINGMIDAIVALRKEAFQLQNEELHSQLGRAMSNLMRAREAAK